MDIILASSSPQRRELMNRLMLPYSAISPDVDESPLPNEAPDALALRLGEAKARKIAEAHPDAIVIGSDQVCAVGNILIDKPLTHERAMKQWEILSGNQAVFYTSVVVIQGQTVLTSQVPTTVEFKPLTPDAIERYLYKEQPYQCCGGFKIEALGISLIKSIKSDDPTALIGLPLI